MFLERTQAIASIRKSDSALQQFIRWTTTQNSHRKSNARVNYNDASTLIETSKNEVRHRAADDALF